MKHGPERTMNDMRAWSSGLIGKIFYEKHPNDESKFRTIRIGYNAFANKMTPQYTDFITGEVPPNIPPLPPRLLGALHTMQNNGNNSFY